MGRGLFQPPLSPDSQLEYLHFSLLSFGSALQAWLVTVFFLKPEAPYEPAGDEVSVATSPQCSPHSTQDSSHTVCTPFLSEGCIGRPLLSSRESMSTSAELTCR